MLRVTINQDSIVISVPRRQDDAECAFFRRILFTIGVGIDKTQILEGAYTAWHSTRSGVHEPRDHARPTEEELRHLIDEFFIHFDRYLAFRSGINSVERREIHRLVLGATDTLLNGQ